MKGTLTLMRVMLSLCLDFGRGRRCALGSMGAMIRAFIVLLHRWVGVRFKRRVQATPTPPQTFPSPNPLPWNRKDSGRSPN